MASIILGTVGAVVGGIYGGGPAGARLGFSIGVAVGGIVDSARQMKRQDVGRLQDVPFSGSTYGAMIPQVYGRYGRIPANLIWGGTLVESSKDEGSKLTGSQQRLFSYSTTFAALICKGPITRVRRIWAEDILIYDDSSGLGAASEVQQISVGSNTSGAFTIDYGGAQTVSIAYNASAATVQSALEGLPAIGVGDILVTGSAGGPWTASFTGALASTNVARMDMHDDTLSGGSGQGIHTIQQGGLKYDITVYTGTSTQDQDPTMVAALGASATPAYRGRCYVVLKNFPLALWGNRIPNLLAEVDHFLSYPEIILEDGATVYYRFEDSPGTLLDSSPSAYTLTDIGPGALTQVDGEYGEAAAFGVTGVTLERTVGVVAGLMPAGFSVEAWFQYKGGSPSAGTANRFRYRDPTNTAIAWELICQPDQINPLLSIQFHHETATQSATPISYSFARDTAWHHVVVTVVQGGAIILYVDGVQVATATATFSTVGALVNATARVQVAGSDNTYWDELSFAPSVFTPEQVAFHWIPGIRLRHILADLFAQVGLQPAEYDVAAATDAVDGYALLGRAAVRDIADLLAYYDTILVEVDGQIKAVKRGGAVVLTVAEDDLAARIYQSGESDPPPKVEVRRNDPLTRPFRVDVVYLSFAKDYEQTSQGAVRYTKGWLQEAITINTGLALRDNGVTTAETKARQVAERLLYDAWTALESFVFSLGPKYLQLCPGDVILLPHAGNLFRVRITQMDLALPGPLQITAVLDDAATLVQGVPGGDVIAAGTDDSEVTDTLLVAWSGNALRNEDASSVGIYVAATGDGTGFWGGAALYWSRDEGESFLPLDSLTTPATIGTVDTVLAPGVGTGLWDDVATVDVTVSSGSAPASTSDAAILSGENAFLIGDEVIQAGVVTALGGSSYRLSHLLRGHRGTDGVWSEHLVGERFVPLSSGLVTRIELGADLRNRRVILRAVANGQAVEDAEEVSVFVSGREYFCWAPYLVTATRNGPLDVLIVWNRRTRTPAGLSDYVDESLGEAVESYTVTVLANSPKTITAITQAATPTVTAAAHGFSNGDVVLLNGLKGMTQLNGKFATVSGVTGGTFVIDQATDLFDPYVSGGVAEKVIRTITSSTEAATYAVTSQILDWGSAQASVKVFVQQNGFYEAGYGATAVV